MTRRRLVIGGGVVVALALVALWAQQTLEFPERLDAVPVELTTRAVVPGIPNARYWVLSDIEPLVRDALAARQREEAYLSRSGQAGELPPLELLAISGGGDKGAFGAGLLNGWTASGSRPTFKLVTGVSTGALIAPFAFLGSDYDKVLEEVYTTIAPTDVASPRSMIAAIDNDGMASNEPLWALISKHVDERLLAAVAAEHEKGRILLVATTDLDARQPVVWNMGNIAASGSGNALELFRSILLASAAIPGAFPPSMVTVEADGKRYQEMHVDGGASAQVFLYPPSMSQAAAKLGEGMVRRGRVYVIRNAALAPTWQPVDRRTINIAARAIDSLITTQGFGDLYRIYATTQQDNLDFNLAYIGDDFVYRDKKEQFETAFMKSLYDYGFRLGRAGYQWYKSPPGLSAAPAAGAVSAAGAQ
ncbi:MAG TPA: patatin-like phospholipase family protein [Gammaproteobacteria bacterium]